MAAFEYQGRNAQGQSATGRVDAVNLDAVASLLIERGITPITIKPAAAASGAANIDINALLGGNRVTPVDLIMFARQMFTITRSGIPLIRGIRGLAAGLKNESFKETLYDICTRLEGGTTLSVAMSKHPKTFNYLFVSMINVGESTGSLDQVFDQLAFYMERDEQTRKSIKSATRYPMFVMIALAIAVAVVNVAVIPKFAGMFKQFGADLPLVTKILIGTSNAFVNYWWLMIVVIGGTVGAAMYYLQTPEGAELWGKKKLTMPVVGDLISRASMARYARSFSLMLRAGVPLSQALTLCARAIDNPYLATKIERIRRGVERGESLLKTHAQAEMLSPLVLQMIAVGEESGRIEELLSDVAGFYEREVDYDLKKLSDRIEPILIVFMAGFVTVLALGIFLPMWDMYGAQKSAL
jgi:MSHA biogenesis protein MshG